MKCAKCGHDDTKVIESRESHEGRSVRRRRCCVACGYRFTTYEKEEELALQVQKKDGSFESFSRAKLVKAIQASCIKRPVSVSTIDLLVEEIEKVLRDEAERIVTSRSIGDMTIERLKNLDRVAYVRFASIYKDFKDPEAFKTEIEALGESAKP